MLYNSLLLGVISLCITNSAAECRRKENEEYKLKKYLLCSYSSDMRPVKDHSSTVKVRVGLTLSYISFGSTEETINVQGIVSFTWNDAFLRWNPKDYGNLEVIGIETHKIWTPSMLLLNADSASYNPGKYFETCLVKYDGNVACAPHMVNTAICRTSLSAWPYDTKVCSLHFGSWIYTGEQVNLTFHEDKALVVYAILKHSSEWRLRSIIFDWYSGLRVKFSNSTYPRLRYKFTLERQASVVTALAVTPSIILALATLFSPILVNYRTGLTMLGVNLFMHFILFNIIKYELPKIGVDTPNILLFVRNSMFVALSLMLFKIIINCLRKKTTAAPAWVRYVNNIVSFGPGKYIMFTEFHPKLDKVEESTSQEKTLSTSDWIKFGTALDFFTFIASFLVYMILICIYIVRTS